MHDFGWQYAFSKAVASAAVHTLCNRTADDAAKTTGCGPSAPAVGGCRPDLAVPS